MEDKVYLYTFKDNDDTNAEEYYFITKHDCTKLIDDIENNYYDIIDADNTDELIEELKDAEVSEILINFVAKSRNFDSCYELELAILEELDELVNFTQKTFYY